MPILTDEQVENCLDVGCACILADVGFAYDTLAEEPVSGSYLQLLGAEKHTTVDVIGRISEKMIDKALESWKIPTETEPRAASLVEMGRGKLVWEYCKYVNNGELRKDNADLEQARAEATQTYQHAMQVQQHAIVAL